MIILQNTVLMLWIYTTLFNYFINIYYIFTIKKYIRKYDLNVTFYILMQCVNSLAAIINI